MFSVQRAFPKTFLLSVLGLVAILTGAGTVLASNTGVAPVLVPYTITALAGNSQSPTPGYGGDGVPALNATLSSPSALAVDSVGNVYIADTSNALIREVNAQTGIIKTIAGVAPTNCTGTTCTTVNPGCSDGVPAVGNQVGARINGMVVDTFGNLYFSDYNYQGAWVIYSGGAQVANFISLVDNATVPTPGAVKRGYIYHIAGTSVPKAGGGCTDSSGLTDQVLATAAIFHDPLQMGIDAAGNIYIEDFANSVVRVINTQATTQTFFGVTVQPGFVAAITGCNSKVTVACPATIPAFGGPATAALYSNALVGMTTDQYGNVYELDSKGATGSIYAGVAYAGGNPLAHLINIESGLTATYGGWYEVINSITSTNAPTTAVQAVLANGSNDTVLRPSSIAVDPVGNLYMLDNHWLSIYRVDVNSQMATRINGLTGVAVGTAAAPVACSGTSGQFSTDAYGDGCPIQNAKFNSAGTGYVTFDGVGNLYVTDTGNNTVRKVSVGTQFPGTATGSSLSQTLQVHFDAGNLPTISGTTTSAFKMTTGAADFTVASTTCSNYTLGLDLSLECYVTVNFAPSATGVRKGTLQATTANGSTYNFALSGFGNGGQLVADGGSPATVPVTGLGSAAAVATDAAGNVYIADSVNNRVVMSPAGGGAQTTVGTGLKGPMGVAVDAAGNVYISDSGNSRIVEVAAPTGIQTVLTSNVLKPQGLAVDSKNNLYVADTGNSRILEIPAFGEFPPAALPTSFVSATLPPQILITPVAVAVDKNGNVFVADSAISTGLIEILAGGGDLQPVAGGTTPSAPAFAVGFSTAFVKSPSGVAIDAAGDLYVTDSSANTVQMIPSSAGPGSAPFTLNFPGLSGPTALALDPSGNLYVADSGNNRVLLDSRTNVAVTFGQQAQGQPAATMPLTITNIGTASLAPVSPFSQLSGATTDFSETDACAASNFSTGVLTSGLHCSETISFQPVESGSLSATGSLQNGMVKLNITGTGVKQQAKLVLALTAPAAGPTPGSPATVTLTAGQSSAGAAPSGNVTFTYTVNGVAQTPVTQALVAGSGGISSAILTLPNILLARSYVINASYSGDGNYSVTNATPLLFTAPGLPLTATASSVSFVYGSAVPTITGTVTGILPADAAAITVSFTSAASATTPVGTYVIKPVLSGGNYQNYTIPAALTSTGTPALVTETQAPLSVSIANFTEPYGFPNLTFTDGDTVTGLVNGDTPTYTFTNGSSSLLPVGTYTLTPTITIPTPGGYDKINNYKLSLTSGKLTVTQGVSGLTITQAATAVLPTGLSSGAITIVAAPPVSAYYGTPTGTVTIQDVFTPLSATGAGTAVTEPPITVNLVAGKGTYTPTDPTIGTHTYIFSYGGDSNFLGSDTSVTPSTLIVDVADFTVVSTTSPIQVAPGIIPGGNALIAGEQAATPEVANVLIRSVLSSTQVVNLTCTAPFAYITCTLTPNVVTLTANTTQTVVLAVSAPGTLPVNYTGQLQQTGKGIVYAILPLTLLSLLPFCTAGRRIRASRLLLLLLGVAMLAGASGCGGNMVKLFTPVPAGPSQVVITGTSGSTSRSFTVPISVQ